MTSSSAIPTSSSSISSLNVSFRCNDESDSIRNSIGGGASLSFRKSEGSDREEVLKTLRREGSSISEIMCEEIEFTDEDVAEMEQLLIEFHYAIHLKNLELSNNGLTPAAGRPLASILTVQHETLMRLNLSKNPLSATGLNELIEPLTTNSPLSRLEYLNLSATNLSSKAAPMLASLIRNNRSIQTLVLSNNALGPKTMKAISPELAHNPSIQALDLSYNNIKHKGASSLVKALEPSANSYPTAPSLKFLDISGNKIAAQGMQALCDVLSRNKTIEEFHCGFNNLTGEGAAYLAQVLKYNHTIRILDVQSNEIGPCGASLLIDKLQEENRTIESLNLAWNGVGSLVTEELASVLKTNEFLTDVNLKGNEITSDGVYSLAEALLSTLSLQKLNVMHNKFDKVGAFALAKAVGKPTCPLQPQHLLWEDNPAIGEEGAISLSRIQQLRRNRQNWLEQMVRGIRMGKVNSVDLRRYNVSDEEVLLLTEALQPTNESSTAPLIRSIWLDGTLLRPRSLVPLFEACIPSPANVMRIYLKDCLNLGGDSIEAIATCLPRSKMLQVLCLSNCKVTTNGAVRIADGLQRNSSLRRLNLDSNQIGDAGLTAIASVLPHQSLTALSTNDNDITDNAMNSQGLTKIQELHLKDNNITDKGALLFATNLNGDTSSPLSLICLQGNKVTDRGGRAIRIFLPDVVPGGSIVDI